AVRGGRLLSEHKVEFQFDIFELRLRNETPTPLTRPGLSANDDAVLDFPTGVGGAQGRTAAARADGPAGEVLAIEERLPGFDRLQRRHEHEAKQHDDTPRDSFLLFDTAVHVEHQTLTILILLLFASSVCSIEQNLQRGNRAS